MQIHELSTFSGTPGDDDYLAIDDGTVTNKISAGAIVNSVRVLTVSISSFSSLPRTVSNSAITSDMVVVNYVLSNPAAQTGDWTVTTSNGSLSVSGSISGSTSLTLYLAPSR